MANYKKIGLTSVQLLSGCCSGVLACSILLYLVNLLWNGLQQINLGGFISALLLLISFLALYFGTVIAIAEGVRQSGRLIHSKKSFSLKRIYEGSFLGLCAAVAILSVTRGDWDGTLQEWGEPIRTLGKFVYILVIPAKFLTFGYSETLATASALFLLVIAAPIGAVIAYNLPPSVKKERVGNNSKIKSSEDIEGSMRGRKKKQ